MARLARLIVVLSIIGVAIAGCTPEEVSKYQAVHAESVGQPASAEPASSQPPPPPPPDHCTDYNNMEAGRGHPVNQDWFNHLTFQDYARVRMACLYGWGEVQWRCVVQIWNEESGWRPNAAGAGSTWGIPQAYPGSKMASAGSDWYTNGRTQVRWGLQYIKDRYGAPTNTPRQCHAGY